MTIRNKRLLTTAIPTTTATPCPLTFESIVWYSTGNNSEPMSNTVGDFNGDGHLDIAISNCYSDSIGILLGIGNGTFKAQISFSSGGDCPYSVVIGDFNRDGCTDLAVVNQNSNNVAILVGKGDGTFQIETILLPGSTPMSIVISDYNDDGHLDITVTNQNNIVVWLGNNNGTFSTQMTFLTKNWTMLYSATIGDFNRDSKLDIAVCGEVYVAGHTVSNVYVLLNNGSGYFDELMIFSNGYFEMPTSISVGDFNNDNRLDLVVTNFRKSNVGIMLANDNGTFGIQMKFSTGGFSGPNSVIVDDFNNDGQLDIAVANSYAHNVGILIGIGDGTFLAQTTFPTGIKSMPHFITSGDFNTDEKLDLVITDVELGNVGILLNTCDCPTFYYMQKSTHTHS